MVTPVEDEQRQPAPGGGSDDGMDGLLPPGYLHVLGLLMRDTGQATGDLIEWYETIHSPNARFTWPFMTRYARNYIVEVEEGPSPPYRVLTEFGWVSEDAKAKARAAFKEPAAIRAMASEYEGTPPAWLLDIYAVLMPVTRFHPSASTGAGRVAPVRRRAILLRRSDAVHAAAFEAEMLRLAAEILAAAPHAGVTIASCHGVKSGAEQPDGVLFVDDAPNIALPRPEMDRALVINIFALETHESQVP